MTDSEDEIEERREQWRELIWAIGIGFFAMGDLELTLNMNLLARVFFALTVLMMVVIGVTEVRRLWEG